MKRHLPAIIFVVLFSTSAWAGGDDQIVSYCKGVFDSSFSMIKRCVDREKTARSELEAMQPDAAILGYCKKVFDQGWSMVKRCVKREENAKAGLQSQNIDDGIFSHCKNVFGEGWSMIERCVAGN